MKRRMVIIIGMAALNYVFSKHAAGFAKIDTGANFLRPLSEIQPSIEMHSPTRPAMRAPRDMRPVRGAVRAKPFLGHYPRSHLRRG